MKPYQAAVLTRLPSELPKKHQELAFKLRAAGFFHLSRFSGQVIVLRGSLQWNKLPLSGSLAAGLYQTIVMICASAESR